MDTYFAPAERTERRKFKNQINDVSCNPIMNTLLETMTGLLVVINEDRQIVALNQAILDMIGITDPEEALGLRLGESLKCIHATAAPAGCGTTPACATCGAVIAMMAAIQDNRMDEQICALTSERDGVAGDICLLVRAHPIQIENNRWILIFAQDITKQQFWMNMEKIFFHDINNILSSLLGNCELLTLDMPDNKAVRNVNEAAKRIYNEISLQRSLSQHKDVSYLIKESETSLKDIKKEVDLIIKGHAALINRKINEKWTNDTTAIKTDRLLVSKIIGNMVINALEATPEGGSVQLSSLLDNDAVVWKVWNDTYIPKDIQKRIFQRHFSTKSKVSRGIGTYSMKLFGEKYLNGEVGFLSSKDEGTTFTFKLPLSSTR
jgi:signal transduction histidine kinase